MEFEGLIGIEVKFEGVGVGEAWPRGIVASLDGGEQSEADRETCGGVQVTDKGLDAGHVIGAEGL